jgi:hypothetical protein
MSVNPFVEFLRALFRLLAFLLGHVGGPMA